MFTRDKCIEEERTHEIIIITIKFQRSLNCVERRRSRTILNLEQALEQVDAIIKCLGGEREKSTSRIWFSKEAAIETSENTLLERDKLLDFPRNVA